MIFLIRHALAVTHTAWYGHDGARPLSPPGERQAEALVSLLADCRITRILSSPRERCLATVAPLAAARGLPVVAEPRLDEAGAWQDARMLLEAPVPGTVLCTHRPVITGLLDSLAADGLVLRGIHAAGPGSVWGLAIADGRIASGRYLPSPD